MGNAGLICVMTAWVQSQIQVTRFVGLKAQVGVTCNKIMQMRVLVGQNSQGHLIASICTANYEWMDCLVD